jgi:hypothetical protein
MMMRRTMRMKTMKSSTAMRKRKNTKKSQARNPRRRENDDLYWHCSMNPFNTSRDRGYLMTAYESRA